MRQRVVEPVSTHLLKIGLEVFPVYGDEWSAGAWIQWI